MLHRPRANGQIKSGLSQDNVNLRSLTPVFEWYQARFCLDTLIVVETDVLVDQLFG